MTVWSYSLYLLISTAMTVWVARTLHKNGRIFLVEAACIGLMGGLLGIFLGWSVGRLINLGANWYIESQGGTAGNLFTLPWWLFAGALAFSVLVSLVAGSYPAGRAARLDPIQALRHD